MKKIIMLAAFVGVASFASTASAQSATPTPANMANSTHVHALELTLLKGEMDLPKYSDYCVAHSYDTPGVPDGCRCVLYVKKQGATISLMLRCPDGTAHTVASW